jgi:hypothetical protein
MDSENKSVDSDKPGRVSKTLTVIAFPASAAIGLLRANSTLEGFLYDNVKDHGALRDIRGVSDEHATEAQDKMGGLFARRRAASNSAINRIKNGEKVNFPKETREIRKDFAKAYKERLKALSLDTPIQKWEMIEDHQKWPIVMNGLEAAAITLGALLFFAENKRIARLFNGDDKQKNNEAPAR